MRQRQAATRGILVSQKEYQLSISEARALLPDETQTNLRQQARQQAWQQLVEPEIFATAPNGQQLSDTIAHLQENSQQRARLAQQVLAEFVQEKIGAGSHQEKITNAALTKLSAPETQHWQALQEHAVRTREELYRGFESLDLIRREIEQTRTDNIVLREQPELGRVAVPEQFAQGSDTPLQHAAPEQPERNLTPQIKDERPTWIIASEQQWHFDHLPAPHELPYSQVPLTPAREETGHEFSYER